MEHDLLNAILIGLFGPTIAKWLSRFRYWIIFTATVIAVPLMAFIQNWRDMGFDLAFDQAKQRNSTLEGFVIPIMLGLLMVFITFLGSTISTKKTDEKDGKKKDL